MTDQIAEFARLTNLNLLDLPGRPSACTRWRWATRGLLVRGKRVRLESVRCGRGRFCSPEMVSRFLEALNSAAPEPPSAEAQQASEQLRTRLAGRRRGKGA